MTKRRALKIFKDINSPDYTVNEKLYALEMIMLNDMYDRLSKKDIIRAFKWELSWYLTDGEE